MNKAKVTFKFSGAQMWRNGSDCATKYRIYSFKRSLASTRCDKCWLLLIKQILMNHLKILYCSCSYAAAGKRNKEFYRIQTTYRSNCSRGLTLRKHSRSRRCVSKVVIASRISTGSSVMLIHINRMTH